ncbi:MAG: class I SAM-dependent methyltransferase [Pseudomonadales bacterium]
MANDPSQRLADWFTGAHGGRLLREERPLLGEAVRRFHGDTLLWVGCHGDIAGTVRGCMVRHRLFASEPAGAGPEELSTLRCALEALPLPNGSLDAVVLHHALEVSADARSGLREVARVLAPGGRLVVCMFNPLSLWGARRAYARFGGDAFSGLRFVTSFRLLDWLALLGFERQAAVQYLSYNLPFSRPSRDQQAPAGRMERTLRRIQAPFGGVYLVSAVKQAAALRPHWRAARVKGPKLLPAAYPKSAVSREPAPVLQFSDWKDLERGG